MRYWDTSAIVPLLVEESASARVRRWLEDDAAIVTWAWTRVELASAVERRAREGAIDRRQRRELMARIEALRTAWDEVVDLLAVRSRALLLLARHPLRAADAAQLAAALLVADAGACSFVCLDERLALAAEQEGLLVVV